MKQKELKPGTYLFKKCVGNYFMSSEWFVEKKIKSEVIN